MIKCGPRAIAKCPYKQPCGEHPYFLDGSDCDKFNQKVLEPPPTNADRIRAMSDEELAGFISQIAYARHTPWSSLFERAFCDRCPTETVVLERYREPLGMHECDFSAGTCPHGSDVAYWLRQPAEEKESRAREDAI